MAAAQQTWGAFTRHPDPASGQRVMRYFHVWEYLQEFGQTRADRASNLYASYPNHFLFPTRRLAFAPSQTQLRVTREPDMYTLRVRQNTALSCTCADFQSNTLLDDSFECKHMLAFQEYVEQQMP